MALISVNAMGDSCPIPVVKAKKAVLERKNGSDVIEVHVDNTVSVANVLKMFAHYGLSAVSKEEGKGHFVITASGEIKNNAEKGDFNADACSANQGAGLVIAIGSSEMGTGDKVLGSNLMKAFIFAVTQQDELPKTMLFFNSGANITCKDSASLEDLKSLESKGVEILTCGTCLDYYKMKDNLAVGTVTNMYAIVEKMEGAGRLIRL